MVDNTRTSVRGQNVVQSVEVIILHLKKFFKKKRRAYIPNLKDGDVGTKIDKQKNIESFLTIKVEGVRINITLLHCRRELRFPTLNALDRDSEIAPTEQV